MVSVTVTDAIPCTLPVTVNGMVKLNWLPNGVDAELAYHALNSEVAGRVTDVVCSVEPEADVKVNNAWVTARVGSKPLTVTVKPVLFVAAVTLVMVGAAGLITIVFVGAGEGVILIPAATNWVVMVMVPATVPVCTPMLEEEDVDPAGMVSVAVRPPVEN